ncbi:MAG: Holliday junction resolvase RuvX [Planctomycetota bacterium]
MMHDQAPAGRVAGIDYGTRRVGVAISDANRTIASPLENYERRNAELDAQHFCTLTRQEEIALFVVGLPLHMSGDESQKSREARAFGQWLMDVTGVAVEFFDERFSSKEADAVLDVARATSKKRKGRRDMLAAQIILSGYLEAHS